MDKLVIGLALLCSIYTGDFESLIGEHQFGAEKDLAGKVDFLMANLPYLIRSGRNDVHAAYDVFGFKV